MGADGVEDESGSSVRHQKDLEDELFDFFGKFVSEWNPCFTVDGCDVRALWDEEVRAYDVSVREDVVKRGEGVEVELGSKCPQRVRLRSLLDGVLASEAAGEAVNLEPLKRLVCFLVHSSERHDDHGFLPPKSTHPCARGDKACPYCRYGFPQDTLPRGGTRKMRLVKDAQKGHWRAFFPRNDGLCCSYEPHVLLANMGNIDWRPCLNLWAVMEYVTKYATKAPKGSRHVGEVFRDAVNEVLKYGPNDEGMDLLRRSCQKFYARTVGERDYTIFEATHLGLQLPMVLPLMPVVSLNTYGTRRMKTAREMQSSAPDEPVTYKSRVDLFDERLKLLREQAQRRKQSATDILEEEIKNVSFYEFFWKYYVSRGIIKRCTTDVCLMVTPTLSADCASVSSDRHESFARPMVVAFWRMMATSERRALIRERMGLEIAPCDELLWGESVLEPGSARYLGVADLVTRFQDRKDSQGRVHGWGLALMEMLLDPVLRWWVPSWLVEQYERQNPTFRRCVEWVLQAPRTERERGRRVKEKRELGKDVRTVPGVRPRSNGAFLEMVMDAMV